MNVRCRPVALGRSNRPLEFRCGFDDSLGKPPVVDPAADLAR